MKTTINLRVEIECTDDSVDKGKVADFICSSLGKKFKKINEVWVWDGDKLIVKKKK